MAKKTELGTAENVEFKLIHINTLEFGFTQITKKFEGNSSPVNYNIDPKIGVNMKLGHITVTLEVTAKILETDESFFKGVSLFVFEVSNINGIAEQTEKNQVSFKDLNQVKPFLASLIGISYSTMRGILIEKGAGTILQTDHLPLIDPKVFLKI